MCLLYFGLLTSVFSIQTYNEQGEFSVFVENRHLEFIERDITHTFTFNISNNLNTKQNFSLNLGDQNGWEQNFEEENFLLNKNSSKEISFTVKTNRDFGYTSKIVGPDETVIKTRDEYVGPYLFPITISGRNENVEVVFEVTIKPPTSTFEGEIISPVISPNKPLEYSLHASNFKDEISGKVRVELDNIFLSAKELSFTEDTHTQILSSRIPSTIAPSIYSVEIFFEVEEEEGKISEWKFSKDIKVEEFKKIIPSITSKRSLLQRRDTISLENIGNVKDTFTKKIPFTWYDRLFFTSSHNYEIEDNVVVFSIELEQGERFELWYSLNFLGFYLISILIVLIYGIILFRKITGPLDVEVQVHDFKKVLHEGIKSFKIKIGIENLSKREIKKLEVIFKMPVYLKIKPKSFIVLEPKKVLRGRTQYKLLWRFKNLKHNETRIIGFTLVNEKGILGDLNFPDLELNIYKKRKKRTFYSKIPTIKG